MGFFDIPGLGFRGFGFKGLGLRVIRARASWFVSGRARGFEVSMHGSPGVDPLAAQSALSPGGPSGRFSV